MNTSFIPYDIRFKQWDMEKKIKEELKDPNFLNIKRSYGDFIPV